MKILVLNGSPKREQSDTMCITRAFLEGMRDAAPQEIDVIDVIDRHIEYCTGCFACKMNGGTCIHDDDMRAVLNKILESDLLLFSFPLYCYGMLGCAVYCRHPVHCRKAVQENESAVPGREHAVIIPLLQGLFCPLSGNRKRNKYWEPA